MTPHLTLGQWLAAFLITDALLVALWIVGRWGQEDVEADRTFTPLGSFERRSPDGDGLGRTGPTSRLDSAHSGELPIADEQAKSSGATTAAKAERNSPKAGAGSEPAASHSHDFSQGFTAPIHILPFEPRPEGYALSFSRKERIH